MSGRNYFRNVDLLVDMRGKSIIFGPGVVTMRAIILGMSMLRRYIRRGCGFLLWALYVKKSIRPFYRHSSVPGILSLRPTR